jgi:hypothetical protein
MKFKVLALSLLASAALLTPMKAADKDQSGFSLRVPVNAGAVTGSFDIKRFAVVNGQMNAIGVLNVTSGAKNVITTIAWPVQLNSAPASAANTTNLAGLAAAPVAAAACPILHLTLGPLNLNLLGLVISIPNPIVIDITAVPGPGNLLGNLLCDVANLLNGNTALQNLVNALNQLLASL